MASPRLGSSASCAVLVGAGLMAPGIAAALASAGLCVRVVARREAAATQAARRASQLSASEILSGPIDEQSFIDASLVIETISEDLDAKRQVLAHVEPWLAPEAVIATNTSSLRLEDLAAVLVDPERFVGLHFLNPAEATAIVEITPAPGTQAEVVALLVELARRMGKRPLVLDHASPGFVWNRLQAAMLRECLALLEEGVAEASDIDAAVSDGLAPRWLAAGPLRTADLGGLETFRRVADGLFPYLSADLSAPARLAELADRNGSFYEWTPQTRAATEKLRAEALAVGRRLARPRAEIQDCREE
jgi:3-hydroxybutyryl-CoA dehydrogenase